MKQKAQINSVGWQHKTVDNNKTNKVQASRFYGTASHHVKYCVCVCVSGGGVCIRWSATLKGEGKPDIGDLSDRRFCLGEPWPGPAWDCRISPRNCPPQQTSLYCQGTGMTIGVCRQMIGSPTSDTRIGVHDLLIIVLVYNGLGGSHRFDLVLLLRCFLLLKRSISFWLIWKTFTISYLPPGSYIQSIPHRVIPSPPPATVYRKKGGQWCVVESCSGLFLNCVRRNQE